MNVTCLTTCNQNATLGLETPLTKRIVNNGDNWVTYELSGIQEDSTPICFSNCGANQTIASMSLSVYCKWLGLGLNGACWLGAVGPGRVSLKVRWAHLQKASLLFKNSP